MEDYNLRNEVTDKFSLRGRVFNKIREDILTGEYKKEDAIHESKVSKDLGVSRTPVREALRQLELEGLVSIIPNRGAVVSGINSKDIQDIYAIRGKTEGLAARWAAEKMTAKEIVQLEEYILLARFHLEKGNHEKVFELDNLFHEALYEAADSRILKHLLSDFHHYAQRVRRESLRSYERAIESIKEHEKIVKAIAEHNAEQAECLTNEHVMNTSQYVASSGIPESLD